MEVTEVVLDSPASMHLHELADSTSHVYKLLRPWCFSEQPLAIFEPIRIQALSYVQAIDFSITAAQNGFNFCEDVITFAELLDSSTEMERQEYLRGLVALAQQAAENAERAKDRFRNVRSIVGKLVQNIKKQQNFGVSERTSSTDNKLKEFEDGVSTLEHFSACISTYISWWTTVHMSHRSQATRQGIVVKYNAIRNQDVLTKWKELRQEYVAYTYKIQSIQDANPDFEVQLKKARLDDIAATTPTRSNLSHQEPTRLPNVDSAQLATKITGIQPSRSPQPNPDRREHESRKPLYVDPAAMLFAPIASIHRSATNRSGITGRRDRILQHFGFRH